MKNHRFCALAGLLMFAPAVASAVTIASNIDTQVTESDSGDGSGSGGGNEMNARFNGSTVNEFIVLRFDLSGIDKSTIATAQIELTLNRTSSNNQKDQGVWGVNTGVAGLNTFDESIVFNTTPGLLTDNDLSTQSIVDLDTTFIGTFNNPTDPGAGNLNILDQNLLDTTGPGTTPEASIVGYLQSLGTSDQAVFLIGGTGASSGQYRIVTTEGGSAPTLTYAIPEPSSVALIGLGGLALIRRRRR